MAPSRRAVAVFGSSCAFAVSSVLYVHWAQEKDRVTMYQNVLRDIQMEQAERAAAQGKGGEACESGLCDLKQSRIRED